MHCVERRWRTRFGSWVRGYQGGVAQLAIDLAVTDHAIYDWISARRAPHPSRAIAMAHLSGGAVSLEDVYGHRREVATNP